MRPKALCIGPGIMAFYTFMGHLQRLVESEMDIDVEEVSGASAGSLAGLAYCVMKVKNVNSNIFFKDLGALFTPSILNLWKKYGLIDSETWRNFVGHILEEADIDRDVTFTELFRLSGMTFHVSVYNLSLRRMEYLSHKSHPSMKVVDAVCASTSIPVIFEPTKFDDYLYVDAAIFERCPITPLIHLPPSEISILLLNREQITKEHKTLLDYVFTLVDIIAQRMGTDDTDLGKFSVTRFNVPHDINLFDFRMSLEEKTKLYTLGYHHDVAANDKQ